MKYTVYLHLNKMNGKKYYGITSRKPERRWGIDGIGYKRHILFYNAINKYGWDNFEHLIIKTNLSKEEAETLEKELIIENKTYNKKYGYNLTLGGEGGTPNEETKRKLRLKAQGRKLSKETRNKISKSGKGQKRSEEFKKKITEINKNRVHSEETKKKIGEKSKGRYYSKELRERMGRMHERKVICITTNEIFNSLKQAAEHVGAYPQNIYKCCKDKKGKCKGFEWMYLDEYKQQAL